MSTNELCFSSAVVLRARLASGELGAREVMQAHLDRIAQVNPALNAVVTLDAEGALASADAADARRARGEPLGALHGLPVGVKDLVATKGMRTTYGSLLFRDHVPSENALAADRLEAAGAIIIGKTNTPEFGCGGGQTTNAVFGQTLNPYDLNRSCGSSSGGSAVALAARMVPLADGSDFGGSLRHPAGHCNVVGFRPSPGRVPRFPTSLGWFTLSVDGPMARTVADVALLLSAQAGPDARSPIALDEDGARFRAPLQRDFKGVTIAWSRNLGFLPVDPRITEVCERQRATFEALGCNVIDADPEIREALDVFKVLRAWRYTLDFGARVRDPRQRAVLKDQLVWNTEEGFKLSAEDVARAEGMRTVLYQRMREFMQRYEYLVLPTNPTPALPIDQNAISEIDGVAMRDYVEGGALKSAISVLGNPAISVPAGFTSAEHLPVGLQIVGRHRADFSVLQLAHAFEGATQYYLQLPELERFVDTH